MIPFLVPYLGRAEANFSSTLTCDWSVVTNATLSLVDTDICVSSISSGSVIAACVYSLFIERLQVTNHKCETISKTNNKYYEA